MVEKAKCDERERVFIIFVSAATYGNVDIRTIYIKIKISVNRKVNNITSKIREIYNQQFNLRVSQTQSLI